MANPRGMSWPEPIPEVKAPGALPLGGPWLSRTLPSPAKSREGPGSEGYTARPRSGWSRRGFPVKKSMISCQ